MYISKRTSLKKKKKNYIYILIKNKGNKNIELMGWTHML